MTAQTDGIRLFYLPHCAPEGNPDEYVNNDVKPAMGRRPTPRDKAAIKGWPNLVSGDCNAGRPENVRSFFPAPDVRYAA